MNNAVQILIVDDDRVDQELITRGLTNASVPNPIKLAGNGIEALEILRQPPFGPARVRSIVLLDLNMPKMNGHEFLDALRNDPSIPPAIVFALSTSTDPVDIQRCYDKGAAGFMNKETIAQDFSLLVNFLTVFERLVTFQPSEFSASSASK